MHKICAAVTMITIISVLEFTPLIYIRLDHKTNPTFWLSQAYVQCTHPWICSTQEEECLSLYGWGVSVPLDDLWCSFEQHQILQQAACSHSLHKFLRSASEWTKNAQKIQKKFSSRLYILNLLHDMQESIYVTLNLTQYHRSTSDAQNHGNCSW